MIAGLLGEGNSDRALVPILNWVLCRATTAAARIEWIDTARFAGQARSLADKVAWADRLCPCDLLFIHRDADSQPAEWRHLEIRKAAGTRSHVAVVPIRMTEAWLLVDEAAIRQASGCVTGTISLELPPLKKIETVVDPKATLHQALLRASGAKGRRARRFDASRAAHRLADLVDDWSPLRCLAAFQLLEADTRNAISSLRLPIRPDA